MVPKSLLFERNPHQGHLMCQVKYFWTCHGFWLPSRASRRTFLPGHIQKVHKSTPERHVGITSSWRIWKFLVGFSSYQLKSIRYHFLVTCSLELLSSSGSSKAQIGPFHGSRSMPTRNNAKWRQNQTITNKQMQTNYLKTCTKYHNYLETHHNNPLVWLFELTKCLFLDNANKRALGDMLFSNVAKLQSSCESVWYTSGLRGFHGFEWNATSFVVSTCFYCGFYGWLLKGMLHFEGS